MIRFIIVLVAVSLAIAAVASASNLCGGDFSKYSLVCGIRPIGTNTFMPEIPAGSGGCAFPAEMPCTFGS